MRHQPVLLPPPLAALITDLLAAIKQRSSASRNDSQLWLFPGAVLAHPSTLATSQNS